MKVIDIRDDVKDKLTAQGFTGLYCSGECACHTDDIAPCGEVNREKGEKYLNGCKPGYKHHDPLNPRNWVVQANKEEPTSEEWDELRARYQFSVQ